MTSESNLILALHTLQQQFQQIYTREQLNELINAFGHDQLQADRLLVTTAVADSLNATTFPIPQTNYLLLADGKQPFTEMETAVLSLLANGLTAVPALQTLEKGAQDKLVRRLEIIYKVTESALSLRPLNDTLKEIHENLRYTFRVPNCYIALYDVKTEQIKFPLMAHSEQWQPQAVSIHDERSLTAWVVANNQPYMTNDFLAEHAPVPGIRPVEEKKPRSMILVPMQAGNEVVGIIAVQSYEPDAFDQSDFQTLTAVASHVAIIIQNARLYDKTQHLVDEGLHDYQIAIELRQGISLISSSLEPEKVLHNLLVATMRSVTPCDLAIAFVLDDNGCLQYAAGRDAQKRPLPARPEALIDIWQDHPLWQETRETGLPLVINDVSADARWRSFTGSEPIQSWLGIPIVDGDKPLGFFMLISHTLNAFDDHEKWLASTLAAHTAVALQNARLYQAREAQLAELTTLYRASATMTANLEQDTVLQAVVSEMVQAIDVDSCTIFVWQEERLNPIAHENVVYPDQRPSDDNSNAIGLGNLQDLEQYKIVQQVLQAQLIHRIRRSKARENSDQLALLDDAQLQAVLMLPLVHRKHLLGLLALGQLSEDHDFSASEIRLAQNLAVQAAIALEHANLFAQAQRRIKELATFQGISLQLNTPLELPAVLNAISESALSLVNADNLHIYLYDTASDTFTFGAAGWQDGRHTPAVEAPRSSGMTGTVARSGSPLVINDASSHYLFQSETSSKWGIKAIAGYPLKHGEEVIGVFTVTYLRPHTFSEDELLLLHLLADQAAVAVRNAALFDEVQRRLLSMSALVDMAKQVTGDLKLKSVLQTTVQTLRDLLNARASTITMLSSKEDELQVVAAAGVTLDVMNKARMKIGEGVSGKVVRKREMVYIRDSHSDPDFLFFSDVVRSLLVVPLTIRDSIIGTLTVDSDRPNAFSESDLQLMTIAAAQVSVAIANARLFEDLEDHAHELMAAYEELKESDRLKDELVQNVSHELRTPLTFVKGYVDLLMDGHMGLVTPEQQDTLQIVAEKTDEITRIISDIVTLQRINTGNLELIDVQLDKFVKTAVASHQMVAHNKGLKIVYNQIDEGQATRVQVDRDRLNQVIDNLINNAIKFSPDGGTITVSLSDEKTQVHLAVADEGVGVPKEKQSRIFERFYQVDGSSRRRFGGTGVGLAIVKRIVDAHSGRIWVESEEGRGSAFHILLPKTPKDALIRI